MSDHQEKRPVGEITYFNHQKKFGFIKTLDGESFFFFSSPQSRLEEKQQGLVQRMFTPFVGDTVSFLIRLSQQKKGELEAYGLKWLGNSHKESLLLAMKSDPTILGEVIPGHESVYYLKPENHTCWLKIVSGPWDENLTEFLEDKEGSWMNFKIVQKKHLQRMKAILVESPKSSLFHYLTYHQKAAIPIPLRILVNKKDKIKVQTVEGEVLALIQKMDISDPGKLLWLRTLKKDMVVDGFVNHVFLTSKCVVVDFFNSYDPMQQDFEGDFFDFESVEYL